MPSALSLPFRTAMLIFGVTVLFLAIITAHDSAIYRTEVEEACAELGGWMDWNARRCKGMIKRPAQ